MRIDHKWLTRRHACPGQVTLFDSLYPEGFEVTREGVMDAQTNDLDVIWAGVRLLTQKQRREFIVFTLHQRQPHLVALFRKAGMDEPAAAIAALDWTDLSAAEVVLNAARDATTWVAQGARATWAARAAARDAAWDAWDARDAARREQVEWICTARGLP